MRRVPESSDPVDGNATTLKGSCYCVSLNVRFVGYQQIEACRLHGEKSNYTYWSLWSLSLSNAAYIPPVVPN